MALSDEEWLALMRRYDDDTGWGMPRRAGIEGGVVELSRHLGNLVRTDPSRFISLASEFGQDISSLYVSEFLKGLAESPAAPSLVFSACRTIWERRKEDPMVQKAICEAVSKRAKENI
ncbi:MAG: hypothetical protein O7E55_00635, partial [Chloroflexi bacterium]|nr:hypothetical protein [Chloroflexota bacterium]